jgi:hypothetical protein
LAAGARAASQRVDCPRHGSRGKRGSQGAGEVVADARRFPLRPTWTLTASSPPRAPADSLPLDAERAVDQGSWVALPEVGDRCAQQV